MLTISEAKALAERAREAAEITRNSYESHWIEDDITRELFSNISNKMNERDVTRHLISTAKVQDHSSYPVESVIGADFMIVVIFAMQNEVTGTGVIGQAKRWKTWNENNDIDGMVADIQDDCETMENITSGSFGTIYYPGTYRFFPSVQLTTIESSRFKKTGKQLCYQVPNRATFQFFVPLLRGFRGDKWVYRNMEELLNATDKSDIPSRRPYTDGGNEFEQGANGPLQALIVTISDKERNYTTSERLPFDNEEILSNLDI